MTTGLFGSALKSKARDPGEGHRIELALAAARERVLHIYIRQAIEFIRLAGDRLPAMEAIDIYLRMTRLDASNAAEVRTRTLAELADMLLDEGGFTHSIQSDASGEPEEPWHGIDRVLRRRKDRELRSWCDLHAARTTAACITVHVVNAVAFAELEETPSYPAAIAEYLDALGVPEEISPTIEWFALARLARTHLPGLVPPLHWCLGDAALPGQQGDSIGGRGDKVSDSIA